MRSKLSKSENRAKSSTKNRGDRIFAARGLKSCDLVLKNARVLNVFTGTWMMGDIAIEGDRIVGIQEQYESDNVVDLSGRFVVPGFIDSHVHIESSLMTPGTFEQAVLPRGTTGVIVDPHEIANVLGVNGLKYFLTCAEKSTLDIYVMLSSCVPATDHLETSGARLTAQDLVELKNHPCALGLAEMMNFPGVLFQDASVMEKLEAFQDRVIDGHCPMLRGKDLNAYIGAGISSCHESVSLDEAKEKLEKGMQVLLREGSVAKNLMDLSPVLTAYSSPRVSLCTDDRNPVDILDEGHMDHLIRQAIKAGIAAEVVYRTASWSTANHYGLKNRGAIAPGYFADLVVLKDVAEVSVERVLKNGKWIHSAQDIPKLQVDFTLENTMRFENPKLEDLKITAPSNSEAPYNVRVIQVVTNQIITGAKTAQLNTLDADPLRDILKIAVRERHGRNIPMSKGFVSGFGFKHGAIGSSVGHDSHNAVSVGTNDRDMLMCFEWMKNSGGGFVAIVDGQVIASLALPFAGLMTDAPLNEIYEHMSQLRNVTQKVMGGVLHEPFLQLAFLCLPVIPDLKITDLGLVDVTQFKLVDLFVSNAAT